jgi:hypothetical protein
MELGQMLLSNNDWQEYECNWAQEGLNVIAEVIAEIRGEQHSTYGWDGLLTSNSGGEDYVNDVFEMRSYCWCYGEGDHENGCPPNFLYKPTGLVITWYKHAGRSATSNKRYPGARTWAEMISHCIKSIDRP